MISFKRIPNSNHTKIFIGERFVGSTRRNDKWTVRGDRKNFEAVRFGRVVGNFSTRQEAAEYLASIVANG